VTSPPLAIGLFSGGLDSTLAFKVMEAQGLRVRGYSFITPFFGWSRRGREDEERDRIRRELGIDVTIVPVWPEYLEVVRRPLHGYGKNMNPCIDCKIFMLGKAREIMERDGAAFVFTGEVLGQRPMSQRRDTLHVVERDSGLKGRLLRPLSARLLPATLAEKEGIVDRDRLLAISGRGRKPQMELAAKFGLTDYPNPAGGCFLTDPGLAARLSRMMAGGADVAPDDIELLNAGRHFRLSAAVRLVVGRDERENGRLAALARGDDRLLRAIEVPGPTGLLRGPADAGALALAAGITARYADHRDHDWLTVEVSGRGSVTRLNGVAPLDPSVIEPLRD
jgi:tRNA-specific 2-thiouridylase